MNIPSLERGQIFYGLALGGNHGLNCLFKTSDDLFWAVFDEIYSRDLIGENSYQFPFNTNYSSKFRFENVLRVHQFRVIDDSVDKIPAKKGWLKIPTWKTEYDEETVSLPDFNDWISSFLRKELSNLYKEVDMYDFSNHKRLIKNIDTRRILTAPLFDFYFKKMIEAGGIPNLNFSENENIFTEKDLIPGQKMVTADEDYEPIRTLKSMIRSGEGIKPLYRFASLDIQTYIYSHTDDFYKMLWERDLPQIKDGESAFPETYSPLMNYAWNYNRLLDIKTIFAWIETRKFISNAKELYSNPKEGRLIRFDLETLENFHEISLVDQCYQLRVIFSSDKRTDKLTIISSYDFVDRLKSKFVDFNEKWIRVGVLPKTAIPDQRNVELNLGDGNSIEFLKAILNYIIRDLKVGAFRYG